MKYTVKFSEDAEKELWSIYSFIKTSGYPQNAKSWVSQIKKTCMSLSENPERGRIPSELEHAGVWEYREIIFEVYRIVYRIIGKDVYIHSILDSRRDIQSILEKRILSHILH